MATADGFVLPNPAVPKTLGILNVVFAVVLTLFGLCGAAVLAILPLAQDFGRNLVAQQRDAEAKQRAADLKGLDDQIRAASTDEARAALARERAAVVDRPSAIPASVDLTRPIAPDPRASALIAVQLGSGLILDVLLLAGGVGLIRLRRWGRVLTSWWAGLAMTSTLGFLVAGLLVADPGAQAQADAQLDRLRAAANQPNATPQDRMSAQVADFTARQRVPLAISYVIAAITYPVICLILLNTHAARLACPPRRGSAGGPAATPLPT